LADEALLFNAAGSPPKLIARWQGRTALRIEPEIYDRIQSQQTAARENARFGLPMIVQAAR